VIQKDTHGGADKNQGTATDSNKNKTVRDPDLEKQLSGQLREQSTHIGRHNHVD